MAAEPAAADELVALCGHLPLAVRVIACRLVARPGMSIVEGVRRLVDERLRIARLRADDLDVEACFRLSYHQLDPGLARAFRLLSLPEVASVPLGPAAALLGMDEGAAEQTLDRLTDAGLLQAPRSVHYRYHDLLRLFARDRSAALDSPTPRRTR